MMIRAQRDYCDPVTFAEFPADHRRLTWYILRVEPQKEFVVAQLLRRRLLMSVVPVVTRYRRLNKHVAQKVAVKYPMIHGYVFVGFDPAKVIPWRDVMGIRAVSGVVGVSGEPRPVRGDLVAFAARFQSGKVAMQTDIAAGQEARITAGAFDGHVVRVHELRGHIAKVLMPLFGNADRAFEVPIAFLERSA